MNWYDLFCIILSVFAVFGGYIALRLAAAAALRRSARRSEQECERRFACDRCEKPDGCPGKRTDESEAPKRD